MTAGPGTLIETLKAAAERAGEAENAFRREAAQRIAALERERTFAFRRLNLMRGVIAAVTGAETEEEAVLRARAVLCQEIGWDGASEARDAVLEQFAEVAKAVFAELDPESDPSPAEGSGALAALAVFEAWYAATHSGPFWALFGQYVPQTSVVDF